MTTIKSTETWVAYDHRGIRIGSVRPNDDVYSDTGIRIGRVDSTGHVYDYLFEGWAVLLTTRSARPTTP